MATKNPMNGTKEHTLHSTLQNDNSNHKKTHSSISTANDECDPPKKKRKINNNNNLTLKIHTIFNENKQLKIENEKYKIERAKMIHKIETLQQSNAKYRTLFSKMMNIIGFNQNSNKSVVAVTATNIHTQNQLIMPQPAQNNALPPPKYNNHGNKHGVKEANNKCENNQAQHIEHNNSMKPKAVSKKQESLNSNTLTLLDEDMDISDGNSDDDNMANTNISNTQQITQYTANNLTYNHTRQHLSRLHHMHQMVQMQHPIGYQIPYQIAYPMESRIRLNETVNQSNYVSRGQVNGYELSEDQSEIDVDRYRVLSCIIYVGFWNDTNVNIDRLRDEASTFGSVLKITPHPTQRPYKHAFVKFDSRVDAENARNGLRQRMKGMNHLKFVQKVSWARPPKKVIKNSFQFDTGIGEILKTDM